MIIKLDQTDSTNTYLKEHIEDFNDFDAVVAKVQKKGRGQGERDFISNIGGLYISISIPDEYFEITTIAAGCVVVDVLEKYGIKTKIKWVNDVFYKNKKIAGVLAERFYRDKNKHIVLGIGININNLDFGSFGSIAISMMQIKKKEFDIDEIIEKICQGIRSFLTSKRFEEILKIYRKKSLVLKKFVYLEDTNERVFVERINESGGLDVVKEDNTKMSIKSGRIRLKK